MLKIVDEKILRTDDEIEDIYKDCKYVSIYDQYIYFCKDAADYERNFWLKVG